MAIYGIGQDLVDVRRIQESLQRYGDRFKKRVFTEKEVAYCERYRYSHENYATRFAAKEAVLKALGTGKARGIAWTDVEIVRQPGNRPEIVLHGKAAEIAKQRGVNKLHVTLGHEREFAQAIVIAEI